MESSERRGYGYKFSDRRGNDYGAPEGFDDRRVSVRRNDDWFGIRLRKIFDIHMEETISDDDVQRILKPVLKRVKTGGVSK